MATLIPNDSREAFEAMVQMEAGFVPFDLSKSNGRYWNESLNQRWETWQSALAWADSAPVQAQESPCEHDWIVSTRGGFLDCGKCGERIPYRREVERPSQESPASPPVGWICPACGRANSPTNRECACRGNKTLRERVREG